MSLNKHLLYRCILLLILYHFTYQQAFEGQALIKEVDVVLSGKKTRKVLIPKLPSDVDFSFFSSLSRLKGFGWIVYS